MKISEIKQLKRGDILHVLPGRISSYEVNLRGVSNVVFQEFKCEVTSNYSCILVETVLPSGRAAANIVYSNAFTSQSINSGDSYEIF